MDTTSENTSENIESQPINETLPPLSVGKILSEARIKQGLSVDDIAASIKFSPRQVTALEADDFNHLPELAFVRGFVRSYARLLHIDEVPLLDALPRAHQQLAAVQTNLADVPMTAAQANRKINLYWLSATLGVASLLGLGVFVFEDKPVETKVVADQVTITPIVAAESAVAVASQVSVATASQVAVTDSAKTAALPVGVTTPLKTVVPAPVVASAPAKATPISPVAAPTPAVVTPVAKTPVPATPTVSTTTTKPTVPAPAATTTIKPSATTPVPLVVPTVKPITQVKDEKTPPQPNNSGQGQIVLKFGVDSWVFITDKYGKTIHKQTNPANSEQRITGRPPYNLTIANAKNVRLFYEGEEVDLKEFTEVSVARLILE